MLVRPHIIFSIYLYKLDDIEKTLSNQNLAICSPLFFENSKNRFVEFSVLFSLSFFFKQLAEKNF